MTNLFSKVVETIEADIHQLFSKDELNPLEALNQYLKQSEKETEKVKELVERQFQLKEAFIKERKEADEMATKRKRQHEIAVDAGEEDLAAFAKEEYEEYIERANRLSISQVEAMRQYEALERTYAEMKHKLKDMHMKRMELMGRENVAQAEYRVNRFTEETSDSSPYSFETMLEYIDKSGQEKHNHYSEHSFDGRMEQLEKKYKKESKQIDNE